MKISADTQQRFLTACLFLLEVYRITMGTCLSLFVPRLCDDNTCSLLESLEQNTALHRIAQTTNVISFLLFALYYGVELQRENWCIKYLDMDNTRTANHLDTEIEAYPVIKQQMRTLNTRYKQVVIVCVVSQVINIGVSTADIAMAWAGFSSLTPLVSYVLLICVKLYMSYGISVASMKDERALSAYMRSPRIFNTIDADHKHKDKEVPVQSSDVVIQ